MVAKAVADGKLVWANLFDDKSLLNVLGWAARIPLCQGLMPDKTYNYHRDVWKFCRKTFAVRLAMANWTGPLFWLDADVRFDKPVPEDVVNRLIARHAIAYLGRKDAPHSECGFIGFDTSRQDVRDFIERWAGAYVDGSVFDLPGWHDCWVFDALLKSTRIPANNLTELVSGWSVFESSVIGKYGIHLKGALKEKAA